jgi:hypothetical protein
MGPGPGCCTSSPIPTSPIHDFPPFFPAVIPMSASNQTIGPSASTDSFIAIFDAASTEYQRITGKRLETHPFATQLDACDSPKTFSDILQTQAQAFNKFHKSDHQKLMAWLDRIVHILFAFSAILGEGIGLVSSHSLHSIGMFSKVWFAAILTRQNDLYGHQGPS